jgi:hypothetical protein
MIENKQVQKNNSQGKQAHWLGFLLPLISRCKVKTKRK